MSLRVTSSFNPEWQFRYEPFLFYKPEFLKQIESSAISSFYLEKVAEEELLAEIHFVRKENHAFSLPNASFGSLRFSTDTDAENLNFLMAHVESELVREGIKEVRIRNYPAAYDPIGADFVKEILLQKGYRKEFADINYHIELDQNFTDNLKQSERKRLTSLRNKGISAELWGNPDLDLVYEILLENRMAGGYPMTLEKEPFKSMFRNLQDTYIVFRSVFNDQVTAVSVCVRISNDILYNFYLGEKPEFRKYSPVVGLVESMVSYGRKNKYKILDLGIATDKGVLNEGLARFKQNLGGIASEKIMFSKLL